MLFNSQNKTHFNVPEGFIVFISGVPGVGKTTIAYELLKAYSDFRIIEETDLMREVLRGYNDYVRLEIGVDAQSVFNDIEIYDHMKFLTFDEAKQQCKFMKKSFENIILRQQRKGISSIINGVHIVPEVLNGLVDNKDIIYINLYINDEDGIIKRLKNRNPEKYKANYMSLIHKTNIDLYNSTLKLSNEFKYVFNNIDVTNATVAETLIEIINCIRKRVK